jgi:hypothetical protein
VSEPLELPEGFVDLVGSVAMEEFNNAKDHYKPGLIAFALMLPELNDLEFIEIATDAIYESASLNSWNGNWEHEHFKASVCFTESKRRAIAEGHNRYCSSSLYQRAYNRAVVEAGHPGMTSEAECGCKNFDS